MEECAGFKWLKVGFDGELYVGGSDACLEHPNIGVVLSTYRSKRDECLFNLSIHDIC